MTEKTKIEIHLVLPELADARDACVQRLIELLEAKEGISRAHVIDTDKSALGQLCIHYDPKLMSISVLREFATRAGTRLQERFGHLLLKTEPMHARRARSIASLAERITGVLEAACSPDGVLRVEFDREKTDEDTLHHALHAAHVPIVEADTHEGHEHKHGGIFGEKTELVFAGACGVLLLSGVLLAKFGTLPPWVTLALYIAAYFFGGWFTLREAIDNIRQRRFEIDSLMLVAAIGAASLGEWAEGALLLFLFSLGHALEHYAMGRARRAIEALAELAPDVALIRRDGKIVELAVAELQRGDIAIVKPNERIPADGFVVEGSGSVNQAPITGESVPVDKRPADDPQEAAAQGDSLAAEHRLFAGSINQSQALEMQVTKLSSESTLAKVVKMVSEAETRKSPTQQFTDRFERIFVPVVLGFVGLLLFAWIVVDEPFSASFYRAMAVLVAASPCALAISTPSAVLSGIARAARGGVLIKGGAPLESLGRISAIAFDKTGTLTEGKPRLTDVVPCDGVAESELLEIAVVVERFSDHPLAAAVVRGGEERLGGSPTSVATNTRSITGRGIEASLDGETIHIGKDDLFAEVDGPGLPEKVRQQVELLETQGRTTMVVRRGERYLGVLGLMDTPREAAKRMIGQLRALGVRRMIMISGDNQQVADAVAREVGIDEARGDLLPDDKVTAIKEIRAQEDIAMVGDGVNDAPAMANATVGIAMGAAGSDVALETADIALMADDLAHLPFAVGLSRKTSQIIKQNLWFSLGMVALLVPATVFGLNMGIAVLFHEGSTLLVVVNALRLLAYGGIQSSGQQPV